MRHSLLTTILYPLLLASTLTNAFILDIWRDDKNCTGPPDYSENFESDGDCAWTKKGGGWSIQYHSDMGCTLSAYPDANCATTTVKFDLQRTCFEPNFKMFGFQCGPPYSNE